MQQFVVPQFIDIETKIIGPITIRQFVLLLIGGLFSFIYYKLSDFSLFLAESIITLIIFGLFAFLKVNSQPLHCFILNFIQTLIKPKLRIWQKKIDQEVIKVKIKEPATEIKVFPSRKQLISSTRLEELALIIDTGGVYRGEE